MEMALMLRLAMTASVLVGLWIQYPKFIRKLEESIEEQEKGGARKTKRQLAEADETIQRRVKNGKNLLFICYAILLIIVWVAPLPF